MIILLIKLVFLFIGLYAAQRADPQIIIALLLAVTVSALIQYFKSAEEVTAVGVGLYGIACFFLPQGIYFVPMIIIDLLQQRYYPILLIPIIAAWQGGYFIWLAITMALALIIGYLLNQVKTLATAYTTLQDSHTEQSSLLRQKNSELLETQDKAANLATLQERTRIARDIHDNIGHILVRGILLTGVLKAANKEPEGAQSIATLESTLKEAMDTIRSAVHGWKDDAVDLYESVKKLRLGTALDVDLQYDVSNQIPTDVKLCFLMVIKEALTNAAKHSDATAIKITLQEHPSIYQLLIKDNGSGNKNSESSRGMGLSNIEERILTLGGTCTFERENGFRIFVSIPKEKE